MSALVIALRIVAVLAFVAPMLLLGGRAQADTRQDGGVNLPVIANFAAVALFILSLLMFSGPSAGARAEILAVSGALLTIVAAALVFWSRAVLGAAWSLKPLAGESTGLVTSGPYRVVRHPIYLGLALLATGQALAFGSGPALLVVLFAIVPTFAWRAHTEEELLRRTFGEHHDHYRKQTKMIIPFLL